MKLFQVSALLFTLFLLNPFMKTEAASIWDQLPVISQVKSFVQWVGGDAVGARKTQINFTKGIFLPAPAIRSLVELCQRDFAAAGNTWKTTGKSMEGLVDGLPVVGHIKGGIHYVVGDTERGHQIMKAASRTTGVIGGGVGGFFVGGPVGAAAGGVAGGAAMDGLITGFDSAVHGEFRPTGHVKGWTDIARGKASIGDGFDTVLNLGGDALAGWGAGNVASQLAPAGFQPNFEGYTSYHGVESGPNNSFSSAYSGVESIASTASAPAVIETVAFSYSSNGAAAVGSSPALNSQGMDTTKVIAKGFIPEIKEPRSWVPTYEDPVQL